MMPYFKKGSPIIVYGEVHKPEIFNDREGKPQVSMEITAIDVQFSQFGKPEGRPGGEGNAGNQTAPAGFATRSEGEPANPYGFSQAPSNGLKEPQPHGHTFDDEVPF